MSRARITPSFAIYWVPHSHQRTIRAPSVPRTISYHHSQINDAFSGIWNHTFSPTFLNEATRQCRRLAVE